MRHRDFQAGNTGENTFRFWGSHPTASYCAELVLLDIAAIALIIGSPGLVPGVIVGALAWRRHRVTGALLGAVAGFALWLCGFVLWKMSPWETDEPATRNQATGVELCP